MRTLSILHHRLHRLARIIFSKSTAGYTGCHHLRKSVSICVICAALFCGCDRRDITYYMESEITLLADWSDARLETATEGSTTLFFPRTGGAGYKTVLMGNRNREVARLPEGCYDAVIFNRSFGDFSSVSFRGDTYATMEAYLSKVETRTDPDTRVTTRVVTASPERIAADRTECFTVSEAMLGNYSPEALNRNRAAVPADSEAGTDPYTLRFHPLALTQKIRVTVHIAGLNNVRTALCTLDGVPESIFLATGLPSGKNVSQQFMLENPVFDEGSVFDGSMTGEFNVFGFDTAIAHALHFKAGLVDGKTVYEQHFDDIEFTTAEPMDEYGEIIIHITLSVGRIDDVKPEGGSDSGFGAEVEGWGDVEDCDVDM